MTGRAAQEAATLGFLLVALLTGCASEVTAEPAASDQTRLTVTVTATPGGSPRSFTLTCEPPGGDHPDSRAACAALAATSQPFAPVPDNVACTEIYGGPETAAVRGQFRGRSVAAHYNRTNGCEIDRWERLNEVFGPVVGAPPPPAAPADAPEGSPRAT